MGVKDMSACGNCGSSKICSCSFIPDGTTNTLTGDGKSYAPINYRPNNVPLPRPFGLLYRFGTQHFNALSVDIPIIFDRNDVDFSGGMVVPDVPGTGLSIDRLIAPVAGYYLISGVANIDNATSAGNDEVKIKKNGVTTLAVQIGSDDGGPRSLVVLDKLAAGDYLQLTVSCIGAADLNFNGISLDDTYPVFWAQWMRGL